ncbi:prepilin peptidase [Pseudogracilibacillus auburnensis]|uniref:Type 4 prepilin peptidase 1 n=1 Tax=Pseudogracilibacillus auburnensis TaxID=1494959 RepID=A0A2V3VTT4_9BACI|nr:A24 family peptidase [Pseudogracilibacillus auburnensis]MBO1003373.1 prepilin peptidase [Pseudogracilibacillus auburnensis]PXW85323.1 type 4 prepilin peptidase 1 [Pseudogracilibacillus auburnensis]
MDLFWTCLSFLAGAIFGSFFNVVGLRVPKKIPFSNDRSYCPNCEKQLHWYELIPIISFIIQFGTCRNCQTRISFIYPFIELVTGILFVYAYMKIGLHLELITALLLISMLMIIVVTDLSYMVIPNKILLFFLPFFILLRTLSPLEPWYNAVFGAAIGFLLIALIIFFSKGGMGAGDMKLFGVLGVVLGIGNVLLTFFIAACLGAIIGSILMIVKRVNRKQAIPFGPYIVVGALISYFYGNNIIQAYLSLL